MANRWKPGRQNQWWDERLESASVRNGASQRITIMARSSCMLHQEAEHTSAPRPSCQKLQRNYLHRGASIHIPPNDFQKITPTTPENKQMPRKRVFLQNLLCQSRKAVELLSHIRDARRQPYLRLCRTGIMTKDPEPEPAQHPDQQHPGHLTGVHSTALSLSTPSHPAP